MNTDSQSYLFIAAVFLAAIFAIELIIIYKAVSHDLKRLSEKSTLFLQSKMNLLIGKTETPLLDYKKPVAEDPLAKHFQFKDIHTLDMIFDLPKSHITDIDFTEDDESTTNSKALLGDLLTASQRNKISYYNFAYTGYAEFLNLVEKKLKWKAGIKRKVLVLTQLNTEKKITLSHYLAFEKSLLLDVIDPEIFWGVDICVAVTHTEQLPAIKKEKINTLFTKYDEIWIFEPAQDNGHVLKALGLYDTDMDIKAETEAYDQ